MRVSFRWDNRRTMFAAAPPSTHFVISVDCQNNSENRWRDHLWFNVLSETLADGRWNRWFEFPYLIDNFFMRTATVYTGIFFPHIGRTWRWPMERVRYFDLLELRSNYTATDDGNDILMCCVDVPIEFSPKKNRNGWLIRFWVIFILTIESWDGCLVPMVPLYFFVRLCLVLFAF